MPKKGSGWWSTLTGQDRFIANLSSIRVFQRQWWADHQDMGWRTLHLPTALRCHTETHCPSIILQAVSEWLNVRKAHWTESGTCSWMQQNYMSTVIAIILGLCCKVMSGANLTNPCHSAGNSTPPHPPPNQPLKIVISLLDAILVCAPCTFWFWQKQKK